MNCEKDGTNNHVYEDNKYDCEDFGTELVNNAAKKGYRMYIYLDFDKKHFMNIAFCGNSLYQIELQTDETKRIGSLDKGG